MWLFDLLSVLFSETGTDSMYESDTINIGMGEPRINPANGLPMVGGCVDVAGNPYGTDDSFNDACEPNSWFDSGDSLGCGSGIDSSDSFDSSGFDW